MPITKAKFDRRYASGRAAAAFDLQTNGREATPLYRYEILDAARRGVWEHLKFRIPTEFRNLADRTDLSVNTVRSVCDGTATKLDPIKRVADFFGVPWILLFDVDRRLSWDPDEGLSLQFTGQRKFGGSAEPRS